MERKRTTIILSVFCALLLAFVAVSPMFSYAETPYKTYTLSGYGDVQETQTAYLAYETLVKFGDEAMNRPNDVYVTDDNEIYVADTGNARVLVGNLEGELLGIIGEGTLKSPRGVFVTEENKHVYVADRDGEAVFEFDRNGKLLNTYGKPTSPLYGDNLSFMPIKVVVNDAGIMFIICESNTNGIVEISPTEGGMFLGYFGTNFASASLRTIIYRAIMTDAQRAKMVSNIPSTPDNLAIDERGLIYTVTRGDESKTLKRLNIAGINLIDKSRNATIPAAVTAGNHDNVYVADQNGYIYEYNNEGDLLYVFGGKDDGSQRIGLSTMVTAIQADKQDRLYLLDVDKAQIQVYTPTEFTSLLHEALYLYSKGLYTESKAPLEKVLQMNSMFDYANRAMGRAYFQEENYNMALKYARLAKDYEGYSDAYWEIRNQWLKRNITTMIIVIVLAFVLIKVLKNLDQKKGIFNGVRNLSKSIWSKDLMSHIKYAGYYMKHPIDGAYGISHEGHASWGASTILLGIFTIEYLVYKYLCGFLQKTVREGRYEVLSDVGIILVVIFAVTVCNYLVCTINDGEGTVKKIYTYFCFSLMPYILLTPVCFVLSHVLTTNEQFLINLLQILMYGWIAVLMVLGIKEVNNYTPKETVKIILLTLFTILIMALLVFIVYVLWAQVFEFISAIFGEVVYRLGY
ncbi:MAG: YIP1 family protein [Clostridia bacterium]|nr:YIP1 family protein [Clostridia bacterium]